MTDTLQELKEKIRLFADQRDWEQYHSPKNLAMALIVEAAELLEHFQWLTQEQSRQLPPSRLNDVGEELADILIYLIRLADRLDIDLKQAVERKMVLNERKYPVDRSRGSSAKFTQYREPE